MMTATRRFAAILATDARGSAIKPWDHWPGKSGTAARHPSEASELTLGKDRNGATRPVPSPGLSDLSAFRKQTFAGT
ncbi:MAG TPA: hypothetical protein VJS43_04335, partial [Candidatus Acidoferrales bacterium]|nr:hypothetical protein [Candidatus Acidoferrales bacterium]